MDHKTKCYEQSKKFLYEMIHHNKVVFGNQTVLAFCQRCKLVLLRESQVHYIYLLVGG